LIILSIIKLSATVFAAVTMVLDVSSLWDMFDKHVEMYVPWDKVRSMSRQVKAEDILGVVTPKMVFIVVALGLFIWNLRRRSVC
jgi:hypothetical protein